MSEKIDYFYLPSSGGYFHIPLVPDLDGHIWHSLSSSFLLFAEKLEK